MWTYIGFCSLSCFLNPTDHHGNIISSTRYKAVLPWPCVYKSNLTFSSMSGFLNPSNNNMNCSQTWDKTVLPQPFFQTPPPHPLLSMPGLVYIRSSFTFSSSVSCFLNPTWHNGIITSWTWEYITLFPNPPTTPPYPWLCVYQIQSYVFILCLAFSIHPSTIALRVVVEHEMKQSKCWAYFTRIKTL